MFWEQFEAAAPALAARARELFERSGVAVVGTIRSDGTPRISCVEPSILDGALYLGMMWRSRKAQDLLRDPRVVLRNAVCTSAGDEVELNLRGRVVDVRDPELRRRFVEAVAERTRWEEPAFHLFSLDVESASLVRYGHGRQSVQLWPQGTELTRPY